MSESVSGTTARAASDVDRGDVAAGAASAVSGGARAAGSTVPAAPSAADLYVSRAGPASDYGDPDVDVGGGGSVRESGGASRGARTVVREEVSGRQLAGRIRAVYDPRRFRYDVLAGRGAALPFAVTKDDRMSPEEAGAQLHALHVMFGMDKENENVLYTFDCALWFCHTLNSASVLSPGRAKFSVPGYTHEFDFSAVREKLGVDMRRFFRSFADSIADVNQSVLDAYDAANYESVDKHSMLLQVASERGLSRYPRLAHDTADACTNLSAAERAALAKSKVAVIGSTINAADRMNANSRVQTVEGYDSTTGTAVDMQR